VLCTTTISRCRRRDGGIGATISPAKQVQRTIRSGHNFVVDMDLSKFFDKVQHDVLMSRVARKVRDKQLLGLIGRYLRAGVMVEGVLQSSSSASSFAARGRERSTCRRRTSRNSNGGYAN
jgi:hypothetical protein